MVTPPVYQSMQHDTSLHLLLDSRRNPKIQKYKMKTILCITSVAACCLLTLSLTTANPLSNTELKSTTESAELSTTAVPGPVIGHLNGSKLVITHVVKTLEFEVDLEEDDGNSTETSDSTPKFIETDIEVLNPKLLEQVVEMYTSTQEPVSIDGTKEEDKDDD